MGSLMEKDLIRQEILKRRLELSLEKHQEISATVQDRLIKSGYFPKHGTIGLYAPVKNEIQTQKIFQHALECGLHVYFPRVEQGIQFYEVNGPDDLQRGSWSILEPKKECQELPEGRRLDLLVVPGIAFTRRGFRVGYGKGFYDRYIELVQGRKQTVGLAFEFQIVGDFKADPGDQQLMAVITEKNIHADSAAAG